MNLKAYFKRLQKEGTVTLWKREKTKLLDGIKTKYV